MNETSKIVAFYRGLTLKSKWQLIFVATILVLIYISFSIFELKPNIKAAQFIENLTFFTQLNSFILTLLIGFLVFTYQSTESQQIQWYLEFKKNISNLTIITKNTLDNKLKNDLTSILLYFSDATIENFPHRFTEDIEEDITRIISQNGNSNHEIFQIFIDLEYCSKKIFYCRLWTIFNTTLFEKIYKQFFFLALSLSLLFFFKSTSFDNADNFMFILTICIASFSVFSFAEFVIHVYDYSENVNLSFKKEY